MSTPPILLQELGETPQSYYASVIRVLAFLIEDAHQNNRPDIAETLEIARVQISQLEPQP